MLSNPFLLTFYHHLSSRSVPTLLIFYPIPFPIFWPTWKVSGKEEGTNYAYCQLFSPSVPEIPKIPISERWGHVATHRYKDVRSYQFLCLDE